uniref:Slc30a-3 n=1 Tax=Schmidtea mediterranea TaxID=79327 RepID=A0A0H3YKE2_SCHMD|nr:slc30a-3 [Schmidtea mediterranea]
MHARSKSDSVAHKDFNNSLNYQTFNNFAYKKNQEIANSELAHRDNIETDHCHSDSETDGIDRVARRKLLIASGLCLIFMIAEIVGGTLANSLAIMTDAAHLLSDFASFMISLFALFLASRPATKRMSFGWHRAEVMGALVSVLLIWVVTGILVYMAVLRIMNKDYNIEATIMLITSGVGVLVNLIMACSLHQHSHSHETHPHNEPLSEEYDVENAQYSDSDALLDDDKKSDLVEVRIKSNNPIRKTNINVRAAFIHVIGDLVQSFGVLIAAFVIYYKPSWKIADPICTFIFSILVLCTTINILRDTMNVLMEGTPKSLDFDDVKETLLELEGVVLLHNLRIWSLTTNKTALSVHLAVDPNKEVQVILKEATRVLMSKFHISDATIQLENYVADMDDCKKCKTPQS